MKRVRKEMITLLTVKSTVEKSRTKAGLRLYMSGEQKQRDCGRTYSFLPRFERSKATTVNRCIEHIHIRETQSMSGYKA